MFDDAWPGGHLAKTTENRLGQMSVKSLFLRESGTVGGAGRSQRRRRPRCLTNVTRRGTTWRV